MKLSEAMMLGSTTCKMKAGDINSCAYGSALNALGVPADATIFPFPENGAHRYVELRRLWPWLKDSRGFLTDLGMSIYQKFDCEVCEGKMTFEQLVDYVRSIEPSCGECNRFTCTCAKPETQAVPEAVEVQA